MAGQRLCLPLDRSRLIAQIDSLSFPDLRGQGIKQSSCLGGPGVAQESGFKPRA